jgi:23S rRNA (guanosine2251-2'-O)-methyltransferase
MQIIVVAHNIRSTHNVGSIFRTCEGFGVQKLYLTGYTPYPVTSPDARLPHITEKLTGQIEKTALGATALLPFEHVEDPKSLLSRYKHDGWRIVGLEQSARSILLPSYQPADKICLLLGEEVHGIEASLQDMCDDIVEIPMSGQKESFNVSVATGITLYGLTSKSTL